MVNQTLFYGDVRIPYRVYLSSRRGHDVAIHVHHNGSVDVDAPRGVPLSEIKRAVTKRARWLSSRLQGIEERRAYVLPREYVSGESHFYMGRRYLLKIRKSRRDVPAVRLRRGRFEIVTKEASRNAVRSLLWEWYQMRARSVFDFRLSKISPDLPWINDKPQWKLLAMKKQWGSCSPSGVLSLNPHLVKAPSACIDYVLLHELCHLRVHNHGKGFYRLLTKHMPDWEAVKDRLDKMAELLLNR